MNVRLATTISFFLFCGCVQNKTTPAPRLTVIGPTLTDDSLKKYSYIIYGRKVINGKSSHRQGTGFFFKKKGKIFFVTARHTLSGYTDSCTKIELHPDIMSIALPDLQKNEYNFLDLNIKGLKDTIKCPSSLDIIALEIDNYNNYKINFIETSFIDYGLPKQAGNINIYGYPVVKNFGSDNMFKLVDISELVFANHKIFTSISNTENVTDTTSYVIQTRDITVSDSLMGFSGGPVFIFDKVLNKWVFLGGFVGQNYQHNLFFVVKPKFIYSQL